MTTPSSEVCAAGFSKAEALEIFEGVRKAVDYFTIALEGRRRSGEDCLWFRFYRPGTVCPSFGFSRRGGLVRLTLRDVDGEGIVNAHEPCFRNVSDALEVLFDMLGIRAN